MCAEDKGSSPQSADSPYRYTTKDFGFLPIKPLHLDLTFDIAPKKVEVTTIGTYLYQIPQDATEAAKQQPLNEIVLDQNKLDVRKVGIIINNTTNDLFTPAVFPLTENDWAQHVAQFEKLATTQDEENVNKQQRTTVSRLQFIPIENFIVHAYEQTLQIPLPSNIVIQPGQQFIIYTQTIASPNNSDLEGIYCDYTPENCPQTLVTQCQTWGFRKIAPTIDQMPSKCAFTTTVIADGRYTNILSNGDFAPGFFAENAVTKLVEPVYRLPSSHFVRSNVDNIDDNTERGIFYDRVVLTYNNWQLMSTYLFYLGVGTWITYSRDVEFPLHDKDPYQQQQQQQQQQKQQNSIVTQRAIRIDLLTFPNLFKHQYCVDKLDTIRESINWVYLCGPSNGTCHVLSLREQIQELINQREAIKDELGLGKNNIFATISQIGSQLGTLTTTNGIVQQYTQEQHDLFVKHGINPEKIDQTRLPPLESTLVTSPYYPVSRYHPDIFPQRALDSAKQDELRTELENIRQKLSTLLSSVPFDTWGHQYQNKIYREIGMQNSNYGGMENPGNTTIISSKLVPNEFLSDGGFIYLFGVTIHEYYHDLNGSLTTGYSPFDIWLNEACTVHIQRFYEYNKFGFDSMRCGHLSYASTPVSGPFAIDSLPTSMAVVPQGFNSPQELVSATTYSKAPEIIRTFQCLLGSDAFHRALTLYYTRFARGNAHSDDWVQAMVDISGDESLKDMARNWLHRNGYPTLSYNGTYNEENKTYSLQLTQTGFEKHANTQYAGPWRFAVEIELFTATGEKLLINQYNSPDIRVIAADTNTVYLHDFSQATETLTFSNLPGIPAFASVGRGWSFFGPVVNVSDTCTSELQLQLKYDDDCISKMFAWNTFKSKEFTRLTKHFQTLGKKSITSIDTVHVDEAWIDAHAAILFDSNLSPAARASILRESGACSDESVSHEYWASYNALTVLFQRLWAKYAPQLLKLYEELNQEEYLQWPISQGFVQRPLKAHVLHIFRLVALHQRVIEQPYQVEPVNAQLFQLARQLFETSAIMSDKLAGLRLGLELIALRYQVDVITMKNEQKQNPTVLVPWHLQEADSTTVVTHDALHNEAIPFVFTPPYVSLNDARDFLGQTETFFSSHPDALEQYIMIIGECSAPFGISFIRGLLCKKYVQLSLSGHGRTLARSWVSVRHRALLTQDGLTLTKDLFVEIGRINQYSATAFLQLFGNISAYTTTQRDVIVRVLIEIRDSFDPQEQVSLVNNINHTLAQL